MYVATAVATHAALLLLYFDDLNSIMLMSYNLVLLNAYFESQIARFIRLGCYEKYRHLSSVGLKDEKCLKYVVNGSLYLASMQHHFPICQSILPLSSERIHDCAHTCLSPNDCAQTRLCPEMFVPTLVCAHTRLYPYTFVPIHACAHTRLCPQTFAPIHVCAQTRLCSRTFQPTHIRAHTCLCLYACLSTNVHVSGHKYVWAQMCLGLNVCGHKCAWAQTCLGTNVCGHKRV